MSVEGFPSWPIIEVELRRDANGVAGHLRRRATGTPRPPLTTENVSTRRRVSSSSGWQRPSLTDASSPRQLLVYPWRRCPLP
jgi:hypothetical protein